MIIILEALILYQYRMTVFNDFGVKRSERECCVIIQIILVCQRFLKAAYQVMLRVCHHWQKVHGTL